MRKFKLLGVIGLGLMLAVLPALVEAKAGRSGGGFGSRGARTQQAAPPTQTAPSAAPVQRSVTPPGQTSPGQTAPNQAAAPRAGQSAAAAPAAGRSPFMSGLMGGLLGAGLVGLLFGSGLFGEGGMGAAGIFGLLLQGLLIGGLVWLVVGFFRRRAAQAAQPATAGGAPAAGYGAAPAYDNSPVARQSAGYDIQDSQQTAGAGAGPGVAGSGDGVGIEEADYQAFEQNLKAVQAAWSKADVVALSEICTPEIASFLSRDLAELTSQGLSNHVQDVVLEQGDLAEAWQEGDVDYATVAMRWSALDYTLNRADGSVVEGSREQRSESVEVWTFLRSGRQGKWLLSAIQEPNRQH